MLSVFSCLPLFSPTQDFENLYLPNCLYLYFLSGFNNHYMFAYIF